MEEICKMKDDAERRVEFLGMRPLKVIKIRRLVSGQESVSYNFSPSTHGVPDEEVAESDSGIVCFDLLFNGEQRSLWFNAHTSDTVILDADDNVCKNIREAIQCSSV